MGSDAEDDGLALNKASKKDFWQYIRSVPFAQKAGLVLMDNGNLRAVWKGDDESHLGIQFLGNQWVEYVIFKRRPSTIDVARVAGRDTLDGVKSSQAALIGDLIAECIQAIHPAIIDD